MPLSRVLLVVAIVAASSTRAAAIRAEPIALLPVTAPQRDYFGPGAGIDVTGLFELAAFLDLGVQGGYFALTKGLSSPLALGGSALHLGAVGNVHLPIEGRSWKPFLELGASWVLTGTLSRMQLTASAGALFSVLDGTLWIGPRLGYRHVLRLSDEVSFRTADAGLLFLGFAIELPFNRAAASSVATADGDRDGVSDADDACVTVPGLKELKGCPDDDADKDGVVGAVDKCPAQAEDRDGFQDEDGCPEADNDGDGLLDAADECPAAAGPRNTRGCPDGDGDTVADGVDQCPKVPGVPENAGCPRYRQVTVTQNKLELSQKIFFAFGLTTILPRSFPLLEEVSKALTDRPGLCVRIEGHTDNVGPADRNLKLSQGRADAVREFLFKAGVPADTLSPLGYGMSLPLESNANEVGREKNRRVEFVIIPCTEVKP